MRPRRPLVVVIALLLAAAGGVLYATRLYEAPIYLAYDEIRFALQAHAIAMTGHDINGQFMPLFFGEAGFSAGRDPMSIYLTALVLRVLPLSESAIRLPSAIVGVFDVVLMFFLARRIFKRTMLAVVAAVLLALTPAHFIYSRFALDVQYPLPFLMGWLLCLAIYVEEQRPRTLFAGMVCLGLGVYSYLAFLVMTPVYVLLTGFVLLRQRSQTRAYLTAGVGFALPLLPLIIWHLGHPARYSELVGAYRLYDTHLNPLQGLKDLSSYFSFGVRSDVYWNFFNPSFLFFSGDSSLMNSTRMVGVFLLPVAVLLPLGVYRIFNGRRTAFNLILLWGFVSAPVAAVLLAEVAIRRALVMLPFAILIATFGADLLMSSPARVWRTAGLVLLLLVPFQFRRFYVDYVGDYRARSSPWFGGHPDDRMSSEKRTRPSSIVADVVDVEAPELERNEQEPVLARLRARAGDDIRRSAPNVAMRIAKGSITSARRMATSASSTAATGAEANPPEQNKMEHHSASVENPIDAKMTARPRVTRTRRPCASNSSDWNHPRRTGSSG